jgi:SAM-dependent methyltransferase
MFAAFAASCPPPWPGPGLALTPEDQYQSELWLPLDGIRPPFHRLYCAALRHAPILASTPFAAATSWAAIVSGHPQFFRESADPAGLLERVLADAGLRMAFLFSSFLPGRFHGKSLQRYPEQYAVIATWLAQRHGRDVALLRCLDAACGDGAGTYGLVRLLLEAGYDPDSFAVEGWTIDPLEVWAAAHATFPHDPQRQTAYRAWIAPVLAAGAQAAMLFRTVDLLGSKGDFCSVNKRFDLILCNGLLGGPIIHDREELQRIAEHLARLLRPGGLLLVADRFHGGWKKQVPRERLGELLKGCGLIVREAGEGIAGFKSLLRHTRFHPETPDGNHLTSGHRMRLISRDSNT